MGYLGDWTKKVGDWATNKVGDGRFGSKMGAGTGRMGKYWEQGDWPKKWVIGRFRPPIEGLLTRVTKFESPTP